MDELLQKAFNEQLHRELASAYLYLAMAAHVEAEGYAGFARWLHLQAREEYEHAMKFYEHLMDRGVRVHLQALEAPPADWPSVRALFEEALEHEQFITQSIHELLEQARSLRDYPAEVFLHGFVEEQVEEEKTFSDILQRLDRIGDMPTGLYLLDRELGRRAD